MAEQMGRIFVWGWQRFPTQADAQFYADFLNERFRRKP